MGPGRVADALAGLDTVGVTSRDDVYWTLRQTLVSRVEEIDPFDRAFEAWFLRAAEPAHRRSPPRRSRRPALSPATPSRDEVAAGPKEEGEGGCERATSRYGTRTSPS